MLPVLFVVQSEVQKKLEEMKAFRSKMKETADEVRQKEDLQKQLVSECPSPRVVSHVFLSQLT